MELKALTGLWILGLLTPLIILWLLKKYHTPKRIASNLLWQAVADSVDADRPWQRLKQDPLFWLQILVLICAALIAAQWGWLGDRTGGRDLCIILDTSLSQGTVEEDGTSRLDIAKNRIRTLLAEAAPGDAFSLISSGPRPRLVQDWTVRTNLLESALNKVKVEAGHSDQEVARSLGQRMLGLRTGSALVLVSDQPRLDIETITVGKRTDNLVLKSLVTTGGKLTAAVHNAGTEPITTDVEYLLDGSLFDLQSHTVPPGSEVLAVFPRLATGTVTVQLTVKDALAVDNARHLVMRPPEPFTIVVVGSPDPFTIRALDSLALVHRDLEIDIIEDWNSRPESARRNDVLAIFNGIEPPNDLPCPGLLLDPPDRIGDLELQEIPGTPDFFHIEKEDPILRFCVFGDCLIDKARAPTSLARVEPLIRDALDRPFLFRLPRAGMPLVVAAFSMKDTNLGGRPAWMFLLANMTEQALGRARNLRLALPVGRHLPGFPGGTLINPNGDTVKVDQSWFLNHPGLWTHRTGTETDTVIAANLDLPEEWDVTPGKPLKAIVQAKALMREVWIDGITIAVILALAALALEWWLFLKRQRIRPW